MSTHDERFREIGSKAPRADVVERYAKIHKSTPGWERKYRKEFQKTAAYLDATLANGAGLLMDKELRIAFREFNDRWMTHGPESLPTSFNVLEAFFRYDEGMRVLRLRPEIDHLFSFSDFVDFVTSTDAPAKPAAVAYQFNEGEIYSYTLYDDPHDLTFATPTGKEIALGGVSFVRHGDELSIFLAAGQEADLEVESERIVEMADSIKYAPGKKGIHAHEDLKPEAAALSGTDDLWKVLALCRLDLQRGVDEVRYALFDQGNSYLVWTDDPSIYDDKPKEEIEDRLKEHQVVLDEYAALFELARTCIMLPAYFAFKLTLVKSEKVQTRFARSKDNSGALSAREREKVPSSSQIAFRRVAALKIINPQPTGIARRFTAPQFQVEVDGFWRRLKMDQVGRDANGQPVVGKTWIKGHRRWRTLPEKSVQVLVKSRVSIARAIVASEELLKQVDDTPPIVAATIDSAAKVSPEEAYSERKLLTPRLRWRILQRDRFRCSACGADATSDNGVRLDVDHIIPVAHGGKTTAANLRSLCSKCNNGKGDFLTDAPG